VGITIDKLGVDPLSIIKKFFLYFLLSFYHMPLANRENFWKIRKIRSQEWGFKRNKRE
jgi:hypothetical protein